MKPGTNWRIYQVSVYGKNKLVGDMTTDELRLALCQAIDALEDVDDGTVDAPERIESWRNGSGPRKPSAARRRPRKKATS